MSRFFAFGWTLAILAPAIAQTPATQVFPRRTADVDLNLLSEGSRAHWVSGYLPLQALTTPEVWMFDRQGKLVIPETRTSPSRRLALRYQNGDGGSKRQPIRCG